MRLTGKKHHLVAVRRNIRLSYSSLPLTFGEWMEGFQSSLHSPTPHFHFSLFFVIIHHHLTITYISHQVNLLVKIFIVVESIICA